MKPRGLKRRGRHDGKISEMLPCGEFWNDATVLGMQSDLGRDPICDDNAVADDRDAGFVTRSLEGQYPQTRFPGGQALTPP